MPCSSPLLLLTCPSCSYRKPFPLFCSLPSEIDCSTPTAMSAKTVEVSNISPSASEKNIREFFSFSGEIDSIELKSGDEKSQVAYVTFKKPQEAETAVLLTGSTIADMSVTIAIAMDYEPPAAEAASDTPDQPLLDECSADAPESTAQKAEDAISSVLARGLAIGSGVLERVKSFDERLQLTSTAKSNVSTIDQTIGISEKISTGTSAVNEKVVEMDQKYQVSEKARSALTAAEQKVSNAGSAAMKNKYVFSSVSWMRETVDKVARTASGVGTRAVEKAAAERQLQKLSEGGSQAEEEHSPKKAPLPSSPLAVSNPETTPVSSCSDDSSKI